VDREVSLFLDWIGLYWIVLWTEGDVALGHIHASMKQRRHLYHHTIDRGWSYYLILGSIMIGVWSFFGFGGVSLSEIELMLILFADYSRLSEPSRAVSYSRSQFFYHRVIPLLYLCHSALDFLFELSANVLIFFCFFPFPSTSPVWHVVSRYSDQ